MPLSQKRKHSPTSGTPQLPPLATLHSSLDSRHPHSPAIGGHAYAGLVMSHQLHQPHAYAHHHTSKIPPTKNDITSSPQPLTAARSTGPTISAGTATLRRYERILPKRPSDTSLGLPSLSPPPPLVTPATNLCALTPPLPPPSASDQREQARKLSHSAIERRRRDGINDKIMQLKRMIPTCANQDNLCKLSILQSTIDYIHYLKNLVDDEQQQQLPPPPSSQPTEISTNNH